MTTIILIRIAAALLGAAAGCLAVFFFNRLPAEWLCDYGQDPDADLYAERIPGNQSRFLLCPVLAGISVFLMRFGVLYHIGAFLSLCLLLLIALADLKYRIIPDQIVVALFVAALFFFPCRESLWEPFAGAAIGGGSLFLVALLGTIITKKEIMGFGDIKLTAAVGLMSGVSGILTILLLTVLSSGLVFTVGILLRRLHPNQEQPLGPFIAGASALWLLFPKTAAAAAAYLFVLS